MAAQSTSDNRKQAPGARRIDWRQAYAAAIVGLATFLVGLIIWPSKPLLHRTETTFQVHPGVLAKKQALDLPAELEAIREELLSPGYLDELAMTLGEAPHAGVDSETLRKQLDRWAPLVKIKSGEVPQAAAEAPEDYWVHLSLVGSGTELESLFVNRLAANAALILQRRLVEVDQPDSLREVRAGVLALSRQNQELAEQARAIGDQQWNALVNRLLEQGFEEQAENRLAWRPERGVAAVESSEFLLTSGSQTVPNERQGAAQLTGSRQPTAPRENPVWRRLLNEIARLENIRSETKERNYWTSTHPEIRRMSQDIDFLQNRLDETPRYLDEPAPRRQVSSDPLAQTNPYAAGPFTSVGTNQFVRSRDEQPARGVLLPAEQEAPPAIDFELDLSSLKSELIQPLEALREELASRQANKDELLQQLDQAVLQPATLHQGDVTLVQPATVKLLASTNGRWRLLLLVILSSCVAILFGSSFRTQLDSKLSTPLEVEAALRVPVIGVVGQLPATAQPTAWQRWKAAAWITRTAEALVFALIALVVLMILFNSRLAVDLAENPLLTLSEILGSFVRR